MKNILSTRNYQIVMSCLFSLLILAACGGDEDFSGTWYLDTLITNCADEASSSTISADDQGCAVQTFTDTTDSTIITFEETLCESIVLNEMTTGMILSGDGTDVDTTQINYVVQDDVLVLCDADFNCLNFEIRGEQLRLALPVAMIDGTVCSGFLTYRR